MSTRCTLGFSERADRSDFSGVAIHFDGYPSHIISNYLWFVRLGYYSKFVDAIANTNRDIRSMNSIDDIMKGESFFQFYKENTRKLKGEKDFLSAEYGYIISKEKIICHESSITPLKEFNSYDMNDLCRAAIMASFETPKNIDKTWFALVKTTSRLLNLDKLS